MIYRSGLLILLVACLISPVAAANGDPALRLVTGLTEEQILEHHGPETGSELTAADRALISSYRYTVDSIHILAILVEWYREAQQRDKSITFLNLPTQMYDIAKVSGLNEILPLAKT